MDEYLGIIKLFAGTFVPRGYMECNGRSLVVQQYPALYSLLGGAFGGNNTTIFNLPTLTPPIDGVKYIICVEGPYPTRD